MTLRIREKSDHVFTRRPSLYSGGRVSGHVGGDCLSLSAPPRSPRHTKPPMTETLQSVRVPNQPDTQNQYEVCNKSTSEIKSTRLTMTDFESLLAHVCGTSLLPVLTREDGEHHPTPVPPRSVFISLLYKATSI